MKARPFHVRIAPVLTAFVLLGVAGCDDGRDRGYADRRVIERDVYVERPGYVEQRTTYVQQDGSAREEVIVEEGYAYGPPPPTGRVEVITVRPYRAAVWESGHYVRDYRHRGWIWVPGHWH